jgi:hypothetical protein
MNAGLPEVREKGFRDDIAGPGMTAKKSEPEVTPPTLTDIATVPPVEISADATVAVNWEVLTTVVGRDMPFHCTTADGRNPLPLTVSVKPAPPAPTDVGVIAEIVGPTEKIAEFEAAPPGFTTEIVISPAEAISAAGTTAVN